MAITVIINGTSYTLPQQGDSAPWGSDLYDVIQALVEVAGTTTSPGDILPSTSTISNGVTTPTPVAGLVFDPSSVRSAIISFSLDRSTSTGELSEVGTLRTVYNSTTSDWATSQESCGHGGVLFSVVNGQVMYVSTTMTGSNYTSKLGFSAKAFSQ